MRIALATLACALAAGAALVAIPRASAAAGSALESHAYKIDPNHSSLVFRVRYGGTSNFYGRFEDLSGSFEFDEADPTKSRIDVKIKAESVSSGIEKRDGHLRSADFFSAKEFPEITFKSTKVERAGEKLRVTGDLTVRGVTKAVTAEVVYGGTSTDERGTTAGFDASFTIDRTDFGVDYGQQKLGKEVAVMLGIQGQRQ